MAQVYEEVVAIKVSKLLKDGEQQEIVLNEDMKAALAQIVEQFLNEVDAKLLIEVLDLGE
jgi:hypothetical protein